MRVPYAGRVYDQAEIDNAVTASKEFWLTHGPWSAQFERRFQLIHNSKAAYFVNSGSSANLLMVASLKLPPGSEIITPAVTFPTTVAPIIQCGYVPVFVDMWEDLEVEKPFADAWRALFSVLSIRIIWE